MDDLKKKLISKEKQKRASGPWSENSTNMDVRGFSGHVRQVMHDWATPMWIVAVIDFICLLLGPLLRVDFAVPATHLSAGRFYTFLTAMFMHDNFGHYFFNMLVLLMVSAILDSIPVSRYLSMIVFFSGGVIANILIYIIMKLEHSQMMILGASGGIASLIGLSGALLTLMLCYKQRKVRIDGDHIYSLFGWKLVLVVVFALSMFDANLLRASPMSFGIHLIGFIFGLVIGIGMFYSSSWQDDN